MLLIQSSLFFCTDETGPTAALLPFFSYPALYLVPRCPLVLLCAGNACSNSASAPAPSRQNQQAHNSGQEFYTIYTRQTESSRSQAVCGQWVSDFRPFSILRKISSMPARVLMRLCQPCVRNRLMNFGWYSVPRFFVRTCCRLQGKLQGAKPPAVSGRCPAGGYRRPDGWHRAELHTVRWLGFGEMVGTKHCAGCHLHLPASARRKLMASLRPQASPGA